MINILWVSMYAPYDRVPHAGGQNLNYYLKKMQATHNYNIKMVTFCQSGESEKLDFEKYGIDAQVFCADIDLPSVIWKINDYEKRFSPFNGYANFCDIYTSIRVLRLLREMKTGDYNPDVIILHWTQIVLLCKKIKNIFPYAKIVAIEEDVAYLGRRRTNDLKKIGKAMAVLYEFKYNRLKKMELENLSISDAVFVTNVKDKRLLEKERIQYSPKVINSYFNNMHRNKRLYDGNKNIVFYGAMNREENYLSALWFIDEVLPILGSEYQFYVIGNKPNLSLKQRESNNVHIVGFVESIVPYFESSLCFVAPLLLGAGIKIKILEALSAGIPVLTNYIGIEGIPANDGEDYILCESAQDYLDAIKKIFLDVDLLHKLERNGKRLIADKFNYEQSLLCFEKTIVNLVKKRNI